MISMNTYEVDAVSGATASSEVIKSAVSDAFYEEITYKQFFFLISMFSFEEAPTLSELTDSIVLF